MPLPPVHHALRHALRLAFGWIFLVLGVLGLFLPLLQGLLFLVIGSALLAPGNPHLARMRERFYRRFPRVRQWTQRLHERFHRRQI